MQYRRISWAAATIYLTLGLTTDASATRTVCSDPARARTLAQTNVVIPRGDEIAFATTIRKFDKVTDMSLSEVVSSNGNVFESRILMFQSPRVSVVIEVHTLAGKNIALATVDRTCVNDAIEDWQPYWVAFLDFLKHSRLQLPRGAN
jgi:hypothetical protein